VGRKLEKCWELNKLVIKSKVQLDEAYVGVMLKVHAAVSMIRVRPTMQRRQ
jgi:hypothetical protein